MLLIAYNANTANFMFTFTFITSSILWLQHIHKCVTC